MTANHFSTTAMVSIMTYGRTFFDLAAYLAKEEWLMMNYGTAETLGLEPISFEITEPLEAVDPAVWREW